MRSRFLLVALTAGAVWEGWRWYWLRISPAPEESLTLIAALIFAGWIIIGGRAKPGNASHPFSSMAGLLVAYAASWMIAPPIVSSALAVAATFTSLIVAVTGRPPSIAFSALIIGSMPVLPSLQFTLGYPMRLASAALATGLLEMQGLSVARQGTFLLWQGQEIQFDAPCSGVNMLWAGLLFTCLIAAAVQSSLRRLVAAICACVGIMLMFNVLRAVGLFYLEAFAGKSMASWKHSGVGLISFAMALPLLALAVKAGQKNDAARKPLDPQALSQATACRFACSGGARHSKRNSIAAGDPLRRGPRVARRIRRKTARRIVTHRQGTRLCARLSRPDRAVLGWRARNHHPLGEGSNAAASSCIGLLQRPRLFDQLPAFGEIKRWHGDGVLYCQPDGCPP